MASTLRLPDQTSRHELGGFLRAHRERLQPELFGIERGARRRTPGLRREEVAQLAGVSATWYIWIEQGRDVSVSPAALGRLARTLRLGGAERAYLFALSGKRDPEAGLEAGPVMPPGAVAGVLAAISTPAYMLDRSWTAIGWNAAAEHLFVGWLDGDRQRNLMRYVFLDPAAQRLIADWRRRALRLAAEFRADYSRHLAAPDTRALVGELTERSRLFAHAWETHEVTDRLGGERRFNHPVDGPLRFEQTTFLLARHHDVKLVVLYPLEA